MKFDGVIFDMDGVLVDSERMYLRANMVAGRQQGLTLTAEDYAPLAGASNATANAFFQKYFPGEKAQEFLNDTYALVDQYVAAGELAIKPGVKPLLRILHEANIPMAVGSSNYGRTVHEFLAKVGIEDEFAHIITSDDVHAGKPATRHLPRCRPGAGHPAGAGIGGGRFRQRHPSGVDCQDDAGVGAGSADG